jgi:hypothetical protein
MRGCLISLLSWITIIAVIEVIFLETFTSFITEPTDANGYTYTPDVFGLGIFIFPETQHLIATDPDCIYKIVSYCIGEYSAKYAMGKFTSFLGLPLQGIAAVTSAVSS